MGRRIARDTLIYALGSTVVFPLSLASVLVMTRILAPSQYGQVAVLMVFAGFATTLYNIGTLHGTFLWVYGASEGGGDDVGDDTQRVAVATRQAMGTGIAITLLVVGTGTGICFALAHDLASILLHHRREVIPVRWAAISAAAGSIYRLSVNVFRMERKAVTFGLLNGLRPLLVVGATVSLVTTHHGVTGAVAGTALGTILAALICIALSRRSYALAFSASDARQILSRGSAVVIPVLALYILHSADAFLLSRFASASEVGVFRLASRFATIPSYFASSFLMAWSPLERGLIFSVAYKDRGRDRVRSSMFTYYLTVAFTLVAALNAASNALVLLSAPSYSAAAPLVPVIAVGFVLFGAFIVLVRVLPTRRRMLWYGSSAAVAALLDVAVSLALIPRLGAYGAPIGVIAGTTVGCSMLIWLAPRTEGTSFVFERARLAGLAAAFCAGTGTQIAGVILFPHGRFPVGLATFLVFVTLVLILRVIPKDDLAPLRRLVASALRPGSGNARTFRGLAELPRADRQLLRALLHDRVSASVAAARAGLSEDALLRAFVVALRRLSGEPTPQSPVDPSVGRYLLSIEAEAHRDAVAHQLVAAGAEPFDLYILNETVITLARLRRRTWKRYATRTSSRQVAEVANLAHVLRSAPPGTSFAALAIIRDRRVTADVADGLGLPAMLVAARVVRVLREVATLGPPRPSDAEIGLVILNGGAVPSGSPDGRAVAEALASLRSQRRRAWRRAGLLRA